MYTVKGDYISTMVAHPTLTRLIPQERRLGPTKASERPLQNII